MPLLDRQQETKQTDDELLAAWSDLDAAFDPETANDQSTISDLPGIPSNPVINPDSDSGVTSSLLDPIHSTPHFPHNKPNLEPPTPNVQPTKALDSAPILEEKKDVTLATVPKGPDGSDLPVQEKLQTTQPETTVEQALGSAVSLPVDSVVSSPENPEVDLPYGLVLRDYQDPIWDYMTQDKPGLRALTVWPRRNGKDLVDLNILLAKATQRRGLYLYIGPFHTQTRQIIWLGNTDEGKPFLDYIPPQMIAKKRDSVMEIVLTTGSMIKLVGSDQYDSLMGLNCMGAVFTEFSLQKVQAWDHIRPMLSANGGWALFNGTPRGHNHMHAMFQMAQKNDKWFCQYLTRDDTHRPTLESIEDDRRSGMKESLIQQEYYCSWNASSEEVFVPMDIVAPTVLPEARLDPIHYQHEARILACDVAYAAKGDKATIGYRQGRKLHFLRWYIGMPNMEFASEIAKYIRAIKPNAVFIDAGRGEGVISRLDQLGYGHLVIAVHFGGKVYEEGYANMKALMWVRMMEWFLDTKIPDMTGLDEHKYGNELVEEDLVKEITTPYMQRDEKNQIKVEPKTSLKSRNVNSPDLAETLALTFAEPVEPDDMNREALEQSGVAMLLVDSILNGSNSAPYDPLNYMDTL